MILQFLRPLESFAPGTRRGANVSAPSANRPEQTQGGQISRQPITVIITMAKDRTTLNSQFLT